MAVQLGIEGLQVKLGNSERIHLSSLLEIEEEEMIKQTHDSLYHLIEDDTLILKSMKSIPRST